MTDLRAAIAETVDAGETSSGRLRVALPGDEDLILGLLDGAVRWLNDQGITEQWGSDPFTAFPARVEAARGWVDSGGAVLEMLGGRPLGALVLGEAPSYVPAATCPEVYVVLLVAGREEAARGSGRRLLALADEVAARMGVDRLRVDCYGGGAGVLARFYESAGFTEAGRFLHNETWPGRVLERRVG